MAEYLNLTILSPEGTILEVNDVSSIRVKLPGDLRLSIFPGHAPIIAELLPGEFIYSVNGQQVVIDIPTGIMQLRNNHLKVFTNNISDVSAIEDPSEANRFNSLARMLIKTLADQSSQDSKPR